ncbi:multiple monosaccharide ABC transporter ATP-binding protein [Azospirillum sp. ST 5-10]|uniref:multiple monosaccharide ABC transporter ATP-binding protein n=1 Tax=unclassified Azospirillum TaxID=2630922 RepID=UPI003F49C713
MQPLLEMRGITKTFPGVTALADVALRVDPGEIHAVVGENGAGKSTLMKILSGVYPHGSYDGTIVFDGAERRLRSIRESERLGIIIIHQELALIPLLSIAENIFLGNERATAGIIDWHETHTRTRALLERVGLRESPRTPAGRLSTGKQQLVEIAKALSKEVRLLILDEPTSSLNETDSDALLELLLQLKARGIAAILISHKLNEVARVADRITVLRDGTAVRTLDCRGRAIAEAEIVRDMVGRPLTDRFPPRAATVGEPVLEVRGWTVRHPTQADRLAVDGVDLTVRRGEVVGIAGLMGAGRTELAMSLFGRSYGRWAAGEMRIAGRPVDAHSPRAAIDAGLCYVTEDRKHYGLLLDETVRRNIPLSNLQGIARGLVVDDHKELAVANGFRRRMAIKTPSVEQKAGNLSGGNQQKVVLSRALFADPQVLMLDEPTRGIDVGAKYEIYRIVNDLAAAGTGVLMISSEMPELLGMCDRIYVMNEGRFVGELPAAEATQERIMHMIIGRNDIPRNGQRNG